MKKIFLSLAFIVLLVPLIFSQQTFSPVSTDSVQKVQTNNAPLSKTDLVKKIRFSNAYPNPASVNTQMEYSLPFETTSARVIIRNLVGDISIDLSLKDLQGRAVIDLNNLENGVYFYSLIWNETTITTRKLIVNR